MNAPTETGLTTASREVSAKSVIDQWTSYWLDTVQRNVLFLDLLRERANAS